MMDEACRTYAEFWLEKLKEREHSEDLAAYGKIILIWVFNKLIKRAWDYSPDLKNKKSWRVFVNAVMNLRVP
jgi:hypothetical protein